MASWNYDDISVIQPPSLKLVNRSALVKLPISFTVYPNKIDDSNKDREDGNKIQPATIKDCMDSNMLPALCVMGKIEIASSVDKAAPKNVSTWFLKASTIPPSDLFEQLKTAIKSMK